MVTSMFKPAIPPSSTLYWVGKNWNIILQGLKIAPAEFVAAENPERPKRPELRKGHGNAVSKDIQRQNSKGQALVRRVMALREGVTDGEGYATKIMVPMLESRRKRRVYTLKAGLKRSIGKCSLFETPFVIAVVVGQTLAVDENRVAWIGILLDLSQSAKMRIEKRVRERASSPSSGRTA
ncbi:hypothetical protein B0H16DRAFT_1706626 [Mycena metata]|uniref:Uncharacterized protein n=1 Tax=Mycena metata TaxID=1033252 RepID=A0AAD7DMJ7_9AGAR|nr:hypothetical protein B0H16DRAFT_1706626 [Mycena metata]